VYEIEEYYIFPVRGGIILPVDFLNEFEKFDFTGIYFMCRKNN
jgi:hypothetical protein